MKNALDSSFALLSFQSRNPARSLLNGFLHPLARGVLEKIVTERYWPAFGFIAAEAELAQIKRAFRISGVQPVSGNC
jgi:hypothetical protein